MKKYLLGLCVFTLLPSAQAQASGAGSALSFDGIDDHVVASSASLTLTTTLTFEAWVFPQEARCNTIISRGDGGGNSDYIFQVGYDGLGNCNARTIGFWAAGGWDASSSTVPLNAWTHVAVTYDGTYKSFYINGVLDRTVARPGTLYQSGSLLYIGRQGSACNCNFFKGQMDELRIWNTVRTSNEIGQSISASLAGTEPGLVAYYRFDEGSGLVTADASGHGNTGTLTNGTAWLLSPAPLGLIALTQQASGVTTNSATLNGLVNPTNGPAVAWFNYGPTTNYGNSTTPINISATNALIPISAAVSGLSPGTVYHFQLVATNNSQSSYGADVGFTTVTLPKPIVVTQPPTGIVGPNATLNGSVNPNGYAATAWFEWGMGSLYNQQTAPVSLGSGTASLPISTALGGLNPSVNYHYRVVATNAGGLVRGREQRFSVSTLALTLNGANPMSSECHTPFTDPGATLRSSLAGVNAGRSTSYALQRNGTVAAWGDNDNGQVNVPSSATNVVALAAGDYHVLALRPDGTLLGWGHNGFGQATIPGGLNNVVGIAAGSLYSVAVKSDGSVVAWGVNDSGQTNIPPSATNIIAVSASSAATLALKEDGTVIGWGGNNGSLNIPTDLSNVVAIAAGYQHGLALTADGAIIAWGANNYGQLAVPAAATNIVSITAGGWHSLALRADSRLFAWGAGTFVASPQDGRNYGQSIVPAAATNIVAMAGGPYHSLAARADGAVFAWGDGSFGDLNVPANLTFVDAPIGTSLNSNQTGPQTLTYSVTNSDGGVSIATRTVVVSDTIAPTVSLLGGNPLLVPVGTPFIEPGATASDLCAGDLTSSIVIAGSVNTAVPAPYVLTYRAADPSGNHATNTRTIFVTALPSVSGSTASVGSTSPVTGSGLVTISANVVPNGLPARAWFQFGLRPTQYGSTAFTFLSASYASNNVTFNLVGFIPGVIYYYRAGASNSLGVTYGPDQTFIVPALFANGDINGDGIVDLTELNSALSNYWSGSSLYMTNPIVLGGGSFQFVLTNVVGWQLGVQVSPDLLTWTNLPTGAFPVFQFLDPNSATSSHRFYRLRSR